MIRIGLIGDRDPSVLAHRAIPLAIELAARDLGLATEVEWIPTEEITDEARVAAFGGLWCVPASPYRSTEGALRAIRAARVSRRPFLGTCGGFQHAVLEYARNVLGWVDAEHAETAPGARRTIIAALDCALVEVTESITLRPRTHLRTAYAQDSIVEGYHCRYGLNPQHLSALTAHGLEIAAKGVAGEVRGLELTDHPFFVATLFQPERAALGGVTPPLVRAFLSRLQSVSN